MEAFIETLKSFTSGDEESKRKVVWYRNPLTMGYVTEKGAFYTKLYSRPRSEDRKGNDSIVLEVATDGWSEEDILKFVSGVPKTERGGNYVVEFPYLDHIVSFVRILFGSGDEIYKKMVEKEVIVKENEVLPSSF